VRSSTIRPPGDVFEMAAAGMLVENARDTDLRREA
jgi:hypothetical protein